MQCSTLNKLKTKLKVFIASYLISFFLAGKYWADPNVGFNLIIYSLLKFILTILALASPIPAGVFIPTFTLGAVIGRAFGYFMKNFGILIGVPYLIKCISSNILTFFRGGNLWNHWSSSNFRCSHKINFSCNDNL
jgi:hypothetical protein